MPRPETSTLDPPHSFVYFTAKHKVIGRVRGRFDSMTGTITVAADTAACGIAKLVPLLFHSHGVAPADPGKPERVAETLRTRRGRHR